jgi:hypothetical protein
LQAIKTPASVLSRLTSSSSREAESLIQSEAHRNGMKNRERGAPQK